MDWFLAAAAGGRSLRTPSAAVKSLHCPLTEVEPQGTTFAVADPMELAGHAPLDATNQAGSAPPC